MALGLIQFLLGGKSKKKETKATSAVPANNSQNKQVNVQNQTVNKNESNPQEALTTQESSSKVNVPLTNQDKPLPTTTSNNSSNKKSVSEVLMKVHKEMKETNERLTKLVTDIKKLENSVSTLNDRVDSLDKKSKDTDSKFKEIDSNLTQFLSLYELINNQYNPFVSKENTPVAQINQTQLETNKTEPQEQEKVANEPVEISNLNENGDGTYFEMIHDNEEFKFEDDKKELPFEKEISIENMLLGPKLEVNKIDEQNTTTSNEIKLESNKINEHNTATPSEIKHVSKISQSLLELDTLNIEAAAADAVPLTQIKNNTNALVIILSWMEYLIKKVGIEETRNTLRYYTETLRWMTPEVFFELDKYLRGMSDIKNSARVKTNVRDHIVSLYFISKLNEKSLDHKLTTAVLEIIQE
ncbi:MAG: FlaD/FlaE family flagellar protein [Candidatus Woesearchaeota archaeon]